MDSELLQWETTNQPSKPRMELKTKKTHASLAYNLVYVLERPNRCFIPNEMTAKTRVFNEYCNTMVAVLHGIGKLSCGFYILAVVLLAVAAGMKQCLLCWRTYEQL